MKIAPPQHETVPENIRSRKKLQKNIQKLTPNSFQKSEVVSGVALPGPDVYMTLV